MFPQISLDFILSNTILNDLLRKTDYRCCKNVADKPISDIWPINGASLSYLKINSV